MDTPHRIKVKYFVQDPARLDLPALTPVFHRWIQERRVPGKEPVPGEWLSIVARGVQHHFDDALDIAVRRDQPADIHA